MDADQQRADLELFRKAERVLAEIDRTTGLDDRHADVLAALRIRIEGGPRKSLEDLMQVTGDIEGKRGKALDDLLESGERKPKGDIADLMREPPRKDRSLDDLL